MDHLFMRSIYYRFQHSTFISHFINIRVSQKLFASLRKNTFTQMYKNTFTLQFITITTENLQNTSLFHIIFLLFSAFGSVYYKFVFISTKNVFDRAGSTCWWEIDYLKKRGQVYSGWSKTSNPRFWNVSTAWAATARRFPMD